MCMSNGDKVLPRSVYVEWGGVVVGVECVCRSSGTMDFAQNCIYM